MTVERPYLSAPPADAALAWVGEVTGGARVLAAEFLTGGISHSNFALTLDRPAGARVVLRRWVRPGWRVEDPDYTVDREVAALTLLERAGFAAPRVIAADPDGDRCEQPALLMTHLPGAKPDEIVRKTPDSLRQLASTAAALHRIGRPWDLPPYGHYNDLLDLRPPALSQQPELWARAYAYVAGPPPIDEDRFIHRDYHPLNTLWSAGHLTGVVDWTTASIGSAGVDLGHMRWNLALDWDQAAADAFRRHYLDLTGYGGHPYWDIRAVVDLMPWDGLTEADLARLEPHLATQLALAG